MPNGYEFCENCDVKVYGFEYQISCADGQPLIPCACGVKCMHEIMRKWHSPNVKESVCKQCGKVVDCPLYNLRPWQSKS